MAVVTHGSFDEGPIVLALPPQYEFAAAEETDPIFMAWDRTTGISIDSSQVTDFTAAVLDIASGATPVGFATETYVDTEIGNLSTSVANTYVPYAGATGNVDIGTNTLEVGRAYADNETPLASNELATKAYVDYVGSGGTVQGAINHNDTLNKEGGGGGHWYHLSSTQVTPVDNLTNTDTADTVAGLTVVETGIITGTDGTQSAYVRLSWTASAYGAFDHYVLEYQKDGNLGWAQATSYTNSITIEGLIAGVGYNFRVYSVNKYGTISTASGIVYAVMAEDSDAPGVTTVNSATGGIQMVLIEWTHNTARDLSHYNLYRNTTNNTGTAVLKGNTKSNRYTDAPLPISTEYYYWVKAVDTSGNECSTFSTEVHATTLGVTSAAVTSISADKILITGVTYLSNWTGTDSTKIDGAVIETGTVSLSSLVFTPGIGYGIVAAINAYEDGIAINASNIAVSGATVFTSKIGGSYTSSNSATVLSRVSIYPDANTGLKVTDDVGNVIFLVEVGGINVGDVTIGNWAGNQGVKYDKSAGTLTIRGNVYATGGAFSGITSFLTSAESSVAISIHGGHIYENNFNSDEAFLNINYYGYQGGLTKFRNTVIGDGKGVSMFMTDGSDKAIYNFYPTLIKDPSVSSSVPNANAVLEIRSTAKGVLFPRMTTAQRTSMTKVPGMMVYDTDVDRFCGVVTIGGVDQWWTFAMNTNLG